MNSPASFARRILHVDMDAFFAAIEQLDNPALRGKPVIVGAPPDARGVVSTCSYEARVFGVRSAMPSRTAYKLCPQGIFVPPRGDRYHEVSERVHAVFRDFSPLVEPLSVDEAFLDISGSMHLFGGDLGTARRLKDRIRSEVGLSASVGLAPNKFLAKIASDLEKPDGLTLVPASAEGVRAFLAPLPVRRIWGVGPKGAEQLRLLGLNTIGDLQQADEALLRRALGERYAIEIRHLALGLDERSVEPSWEEKSISHEHTFDTDCHDWQEVARMLRELAEQVGARLRRHHKLAGTAQLKIRWEDFTTLTRQAPLRPPADTDRRLLATAAELLERVRAARSVRLIGFGVSALQLPGEAAATLQPELFTLADEAAREREVERDRHLDSAVDRLRERFGSNILKRGQW